MPVVQALVRANGWLTLRDRVLRVALGRTGVIPHKQEGDGATPAGVMPLRRVLYRADRLRPPECAVPMEPIGENDGWCDDPSHRDYNRMIRLPHEAHHEELWRPDGLYDVVGVLGWNDSPVVPGGGSAIFLHVARPDFGPTEGCVALALADLLWLLAAGVTEVVVV